MDISSFITWFVELFMSLFRSFFGTLRGIQFLGTNLMDFMLSVFIMSAVFPLLVSVARNGAGTVGKVVRDSERADSKKKGGKSHGN